MGWTIDPEAVKAAAADISSMGTAVTQTKAYADQSVITKEVFKIPGLSDAASAYVAKRQEFAESLGKAATFTGGYATRLNKAATLTEEEDVEAAMGIDTAGKGLA